LAVEASTVKMSAKNIIIMIMTNYQGHNNDGRCDYYNITV